MAATMQSWAGLSSRSGIAGVPCQFSSRAVGRHRRNWGGAANIRGQAAVEEGEAAAERAVEEGEGGGGGGGDDFEARLAKLQRKVTSGTGKKAEARKARKEAGGDAYAATSAAAKPKKGDLFIPPVPLEEPVSDGLSVELGMTPYTERFHGRLAALGLAAVLLVELATGDSFVKYHDTGTLTVQVYTVLGLAALFVKYEKEKISIWPK